MKTFVRVNLLLSCLSLGHLCLMAKAGGMTNSVNHIYHVLPQVVEVRGMTVTDAECPSDHSSQSELNRKWMDYLTKNQGVTWPEGSRLVCFTQPAWSLYIRNTPENMERIDTWMQTLMQSYSFPVNFSLVAFREKDIDHLQRESSITCNTLQKLRDEGKGRMISTLSSSLSNIHLKETREIHYPSEYCIVASSTNPPSPSFFGVMPTNFTTQEVGTIFRCTADLSAHNPNLILFTLTYHFSHVALEEWKTYDAVTLLKSGKTIRTPCKQPIFNKMNDDGECRIKPGEKLLLGGGRTFDKEWVYYAFLTLDIVPAKKIILE